MTRVGPVHRVTVLYACNGCTMLTARDITDYLHGGNVTIEARCMHEDWPEDETNVLGHRSWPARGPLAISMAKMANGDINPAAVDEKMPIATPTLCPVRASGHFAPLEDRVAEIQSVMLPEPGQ